jgi:hypothetical protein
MIIITTITGCNIHICQNVTNQIIYMAAAIQSIKICKRGALYISIYDAYRIMEWIMHV